jgi:hypothetical protein
MVYVVVMYFTDYDFLAVFMAFRGKMFMDDGYKPLARANLLFLAWEGEVSGGK